MRRRVTVPARINIIGEHTDYAHGLALPFAIEPKLTLDVIFLKEGYIGDSTVIELWKAAGGGPAKLSISSEIPIGKGMSSSAALCVAIVACVTGDATSFETCMEAQRIEHEILKTPCGLLDQMAMVFAKKNYACLIDFGTNTVEHIPIGDDWRFKLVDSGTHRKLSSSAYRATSSVRDIHVIGENQRVEKARFSGAAELGRLLNESHRSLQKIGVSTSEVDSQVTELQKVP
ncbi:MAG: galactokinase family protein, partial [Candidatus Thermoplasmatota archaeon]|nr:galactokinase family protein [Candidatus Thermoplasmatota archaeon]